MSGEKARGDFLSGPFYVFAKEEANMARKYSTGLRNFLVGEGCLRRVSEEPVLNAKDDNPAIPYCVFSVYSG